MISQEIQLILSGQNLASPQIDAIVASLDAMSAGVTRADAVVTQLGSTLGMATTTLQGFGAALDLAVAGVVRLEDSLGRQSRCAGQRLPLHQRSGWGQPHGARCLYRTAGGRGCRPARSINQCTRPGRLHGHGWRHRQRGARDCRRCDAGALGRAGSVLATGAAYDMGLGGRAISAALGPEGLAVGATLYGGYKAAQVGAAFQSATAQTGAQAIVAAVI